MARQLRCVELRAQGRTYADIAEVEGYAGESSARSACRAVWKRAAVKVTDEWRARLSAHAEELWFAGTAVMEQGLARENLKMFTEGHRAADRALGRLIQIHGAAAAPMPVGEDVPSLEDIKRAFEEQLARGGSGEPPIDVEVVPESAAELEAGQPPDPGDGVW